MQGKQFIICKSFLPLKKMDGEFFRCIHWPLSHLGIYSSLLLLFHGKLLHKQQTLDWPRIGQSAWYQSQHEKTYPLICAANKDTSQPEHLQNQISLCCQQEETLHPWLSRMRLVKILIRLCKCTAWSESLLGTHVRRYVFWFYGLYIEGWAQDYGNSNIFLKPLFRGNLDPFVNNANLGAIAHTSNGT